MDKLRAMQVFLLIVENGSLTAAATQLRISLPSVVRMLAELETHLGVRLINRTTRRLALTEEGETYLLSSRRILSEIEGLEEILGTKSEVPHGSLKITAPLLMGQTLVAPSVSRFAQRYGNIHCNVELTDRIVNLVLEHTDLAIRIDNLEDSTLVSQGLGHVRRVVVASPGYISTNGNPEHPRDLVRYNCISAGRPWLFQDNGRDFSQTLSGNLVFNLAAPAIDACVNGIGIGMFLSYQVADAVAAGQLRVLLPRFERPRLSINLVYPQSRHLPQRTRLMIEWLKIELGTSLNAKVVSLSNSSP